MSGAKNKPESESAPASWPVKELGKPQRTFVIFSRSAARWKEEGRDRVLAVQQRKTTHSLRDSWAATECSQSGSPLPRGAQDNAMREEESGTRRLRPCMGRNRRVSDLVETNERPIPTHGEKTRSRRPILPVGGYLFCAYRQTANSRCRKRDIAT